MAGNKDRLKRILGELPLTAEVYWLMQQSEHPSPSNFSLRHIKEILPEAVSEVMKHRGKAPTGKKVFLFASTHYWLEHEVMLGLALSAQGHDVTLAFIPMEVGIFSPTSLISAGKACTPTPSCAPRHPPSTWSTCSAIILHL